MIKSIFNLRVRYADTDKMGFLYYGHYAKLYEIGRAEFIRDMGVSYREMEDDMKIYMPVLRLETTYKKSAYYDDDLEIHTMLKEFPTKMIQFDHEVYNQHKELLAIGLVKLFFIDGSTNRRVSCPQVLQDKLRSKFDL